MRQSEIAVRQNEIAVRQNEDMRKISAWAAIALVPTAIAGIYGMNFDNMPELRWQYGYYVVVGIIVTDNNFTDMPIKSLLISFYQ